MCVPIYWNISGGGAIRPTLSPYIIIELVQVKGGALWIEFHLIITRSTFAYQCVCVDRLSSAVGKRTELDDCKRSVFVGNA